jgi:hypothetical protein
MDLCLWCNWWFHPPGYWLATILLSVVYPEAAPMTLEQSLWKEQIENLSIFLT